MGKTVMARRTQGQKMIDLAACTVALADILNDWTKAIGRSTPDMDRMLTNIQEMAFATVDTKEQEAFGLSMTAIASAINGTPPQEAETQTATTEPASVGGN